MRGVAESGDDFTKFSTIYQWFQTLIHPALMQCLVRIKVWICLRGCFKSRSELQIMQVA
ncbi:O-methyltransferase family protein [C1] [Richelia intracellularis]|nr:O-methyltransferase family protein [C1] [Richelia intracellularis]